MDTQHTRNRSSTRQQRGITLLEACIVIAVTAVVAAIAAPSLGSFVETRRLNGAAVSLAADVELARGEAVARNRALRLSFHADADSSCWVIHTGAAAQCACASAGPAVCSGGASEIKTVVLPAAERISVAANVASIVFDPLHGTSTPTGTLRLVDGRGRAIHHVVNILGRVRSCTPSGAVAGYLAC
ncbi:MAG: GspH/FimT family protein [Caldimonas sp.]